MDQVAAEQTEPSVPSKKQKYRGSSRILNVAALLLAIVAIVLGMFVWQQWNRSDAGLNARFRQFQETAIQQHLVEQEQMRVLIQANQNAIEQLHHQTEQMSSVQQGRAEIGHLLRSAGIALTLHQVAQTIQLLKITEQRLKGKSINADPVLQQAIAQDIANLVAMPTVSVEIGLSKIDAIIMQVGQLTAEPRHSSSAAAVSEPDSSDKLENSFKRHIYRLKHLFVIRHWKQSAVSLSQPASFEFLKESVQLKLYQAEWALLNRESSVYQDSLKIAAKKLGTYLPGKSVTAAVIKKIQELASLDISPLQPKLRSLNIFLEKPSVVTALSRVKASHKKSRVAQYP